MNRKHPLHYNGFIIILLLNIFLILTEAEKMNVQFFYVKTINLKIFHIKKKLEV